MPTPKLRVSGASWAQLVSLNACQPLIAEVARLPARCGLQNWYPRHLKAKSLECSRLPVIQGRKAKEASWHPSESWLRPGNPHGAKVIMPLSSWSHFWDLIKANSTAQSKNGVEPKHKRPSLTLPSIRTRRVCKGAGAE